MASGFCPAFVSVRVERLCRVEKERWVATSVTHAIWREKVVFKRANVVSIHKSLWFSLADPVSMFDPSAWRKAFPEFLPFGDGV